MFFILLDSEEEEEVASDLVHATEMIGLIAGPAFYIQAMPELSKLLFNLFAYNVSFSQEFHLVSCS